MKILYKTIKTSVKDLVFGAIFFGCTVYSSPIMNTPLGSKVDIIKIEENKNNLELRFENKKDNIKEESIDAYINSAYTKVRLPKYITKDYVKSLIYVESEWNPNSISKSGARGLGQIVKGTWDGYENEIGYYKGVFDPEKNLEITFKHLKWQDNYFRRNHPNWGDLSQQEKLDMHSAAYNFGISRLEKNDWSIDKNLPYETRNHVRKIRDLVSN